jgi:hypothetical protein
MLLIFTVSVAKNRLVDNLVSTCVALVSTIFYFVDIRKLDFVAVQSDPTEFKVAPVYGIHDEKRWRFYARKIKQTFRNGALSSILQ